MSSNIIKKRFNFIVGKRRAITTLIDRLFAVDWKDMSSSRGSTSAISYPITEVLKLFLERAN